MYNLEPLSEELKIIFFYSLIYLTVYYVLTYYVTHVHVRRRTFITHVRSTSNTFRYFLHHSIFSHELHALLHFVCQHGYFHATDTHFKIPLGRKHMTEKQVVVYTIIYNHKSFPW